MFTGLLAVATMMLSTFLSIVAQAQSRAAVPTECYKFDFKERDLLADLHYPGDLSDGVYNSSQLVSSTWASVDFWGGSVCSNHSGGPVISIRHRCSNLADQWNAELLDLLNGFENLEQLRIINCKGLTGTIPGSRIGRLRSVALTGSNLTGTLPDSWESSSVPTLEYLDLSGNKINGSLPSVWHGLGGLDVLKLSGNNISGPLPSALII